MIKVEIIVEWELDEPSRLTPRNLPIVPRVDDILVDGDRRYKVTRVEIDVVRSTVTSFVTAV